jgi:hypothetical protein
VDELATSVVCDALSPPVLSDEEFNELLRQSSSSSSRPGTLAMLLAVTSFVTGVAMVASVFVH